MKYEVLLTHDVTESAVVIVEAQTKAEAYEAAYAEATERGVAWKLNYESCGIHMPYLGDCLENDVTEVS